jgi:hypothetical protein
LFFCFFCFLGVPRTRKRETEPKPKQKEKRKKGKKEKRKKKKEKKEKRKKEKEKKKQKRKKKKKMDEFAAALVERARGMSEPTEIEARFGTIQDGVYVPGIQRDAFERVVEMLRTYTGWTEHERRTTRALHFESTIVTDAGAHAKTKLVDRVFAIDGGPFAVRLVLSTETPVASPLDARRRAVETAARCKDRETFVYDSRVVYDCSRSVTVNAATCAAKAAFEVELELSASAVRSTRDAGLVARSLTVKVSDIVAFVTETSQGTPHSYTPCYT